MLEYLQHYLLLNHWNKSNKSNSLPKYWISFWVGWLVDALHLFLQEIVFSETSPPHGKLFAPHSILLEDLLGNFELFDLFKDYFSHFSPNFLIFTRNFKAKKWKKSKKYLGLVSTHISWFKMCREICKNDLLLPPASDLANNLSFSTAWHHMLFKYESS